MRARASLGGDRLLPTALGLALLSSVSASAGTSEQPAWLQWGGPERDFRAPANGLAAGWPEGGPRKLWSRELGEGQSAILVEGGRLYTMRRIDDMEAVICLDARTGETVWERRYDQQPRQGHVHTFGIGPRSTPLIVGDRLFAVGMSGRMLALDKNDGKLLWSRELWSGLGGNVLGHGYSSSPLAHADTVIVPVGGENAGLVAFEQATGAVRWKALDFRNSFSSPRLVQVLGETQLVVFMAEELIGVDPDDGRLRWRFPHVNQWHHNITMPAIVDGERVFLSSPQAGARGLRLSREGETVRVEEVWSNRRIQFYHGTAVRVGDWVYGSSGTVAPAFMVAVNVRTGETGWRERGFAKANCVEADGRLVILDEDGVLYLTRATPEKLIVQARTQLLGKPAWTAPTIVGTRLYARDERQIVALDLGPTVGP